MSSGPFFRPKEGLTTAKQKSLLQRQSIGFLYPAKKVFSIQIPVFSIQTTVYYILRFSKALLKFNYWKGSVFFIVYFLLILERRPGFFKLLFCFQ